MRIKTFLLNKITNEIRISEIDFHSILFLCKKAGKFNHILRHTICNTSNFRIMFVNYTNEHLDECVKDNHLLCLLSELIENDHIAIRVLTERFVEKFDYIKDSLNFYTFTYSVLNK